MCYASADGRSPIQLLTGCQTELQGGFEIHFKRSTGGGDESRMQVGQVGQKVIVTTYTYR